MKKIKDNVKQFREIMKMDQDTFSKEYDIDIKRLKNIEEGKCDLKLSELKSICNKYPIGADYIIGRTDQPYFVIEDESERDCWNKLLSLSPEQRIMLEKEIERLSTLQDRTQE